MDDEIDIERIQSFLERLNNEVPTEPQQIHDNSNQSVSKHPELNIHTSIELKEKLEDFQISLNFNEEYQLVLASLESSLSTLLEECLKEQKVLRDEIDANESKRGGDNKRIHSRDSNSMRKICSSPYFKDQNCFQAPYNYDFYRRRNLGYLNPLDVIRTVAWTNDQKRTLEKSIEVINMHQEKLITHASENKFAIPTAVGRNVGEKTCFNQISGSKEDKYDWIKISVTDLNNARSPLECCAIWNNYLHPKINKKGWTEEEGNVLKKLVEDYKYEDWESIAHDLGTGRSAYQCIGHFKIRFADFSKVKWAGKDFLLLQKFVQMFRVSNFTPWSKIAWLMDGRSTAEIYRQWGARYGDRKRGTFSLEEDILVVAGLKEFGEDWSQIAQYLPNRDNVQIRGRAMVLKGRDLDTGPWKPHEDALLGELVHKYGFGNWMKISTHFVFRNNVQLRTRYKSLMKWKAKQETAVASLPVSRLPKPTKGDRSLNGLWEAAKNIVKNKLKVDPRDSNCQYSVIYELSQILKPHKKRGRKKGTINFPLFQKEFYNIFHVTYGQRGGRGKFLCNEEKLPTLVYQTVLALQVFNAKIILPTEKEMINKDCSMFEMDKSVGMFLIDRKEFVQDNCKFIQFESSGSTMETSDSLVYPVCSVKSVKISESEEKRNEEWYPFCPPSTTTLIGLRTMLLNRVNVRDQSRGFTLQDINKTYTRSSPKTDRYRHACVLWNKRLGMLYTWAAFLSKMYPLEPFITDNTSETNSMSSREMKSKPKKGRRQKCKRACKGGTDIDTSVQVQDNNVMTQVRQKRAYVKSGKFTVKAKINDVPRRNTRFTKVDC